MQFVVELEGKVSDITAMTNHGYGFEEEAIRVLKKAAKWEPAIQNGRPVKAYRRQVIIFEVPEE
jgi:protein TonB